MYRNVEDTLWNKEWFINLTDTEKLVYLFLITSKETNAAGICECAPILIGAHLNKSSEEVKTAIKSLYPRIVMLSDSKFYIRHFSQYQWVSKNTKFETAIVNAFKKLDTNELKIILSVEPELKKKFPKVFGEIDTDENGLPIDYLSITYPLPIDNQSITNDSIVSDSVSDSEKKEIIKKENFNFEKDELKEAETSKEKEPSQSLTTLADVSRNDPPTVPPDPPTVPPVPSIEDDFTRDSNRIQTAYKRLFKYDGDTSCLVSLLQGNTPDDIVDVMRWASKAHHWIVKSVPPEKFLENFKKIKAIKRDVDTYDARFSNGKSPPAGVDKEFLEKLEMFVKSKRLE